MRDPNRIDNILAVIGEVWYRNPDLRLGQLIINVIHDPELYYIEDEDLVKRIANFYHGREVEEEFLDIIENVFGEEAVNKFKTEV